MFCYRPVLFGRELAACQVVLGQPLVRRRPYHHRGIPPHGKKFITIHKTAAFTVQSYVMTLLSWSYMRQNHHTRLYLTRRIQW